MKQTVCALLSRCRCLSVLNHESKPMKQLADAVTQLDYFELSVLNHESKPMKRSTRASMTRCKSELSVLNHESKPMKPRAPAALLIPCKAFSTQPRVETDETERCRCGIDCRWSFSTQPRVETDETSPEDVEYIKSFGTFSTQPRVETDETTPRWHCSKRPTVFQCSTPSRNG